MVFELFKVGFAFQTPHKRTRQAQTFNFTFQNAMRATMELYGDAMEYPAVHAQVALGNEDLTVKVKPGCGFWRVWRVVCVTSLPLWQVSDRGGGVPLRKIDRLFTYTYSTAPRPSLDGSRAAPLVSGADTRRLKQPILKWILPPAVPGWLRIRPPHLSTVRALLSGRPEALLPGGLWNRCSHLHPGDWFYVNTGFSLRSWGRSYARF